MPPAPGVARPDLGVAIAASDRLSAGLADQWRQRPVTPDAVAFGSADLLLVELVDGVVPGFGPPAEPEVVALLAAADRSSVPVVLWITSGRPPSGADRTAAVAGLIEAASVVFVADLLEAWQELVPHARLLAPAATARRLARDHRAGDGAEPRAVLVSAGPPDALAAGLVATAVAPALRPLVDQLDVLLLDHDLPARGVLPRPLTELAHTTRHTGVVDAIAAAAVVVDGPRRTPGDTWTVLEAAAAGTPVVSLAGLHLPEGLVAATPGGATEVRAEVVARLHQPELADREALVQRRAVLERHTFAHRAGELLAAVGRPEPTAAESTVSAVVPTNRPHEIDNVLASIGRQAHRSVELVLVLHGIELPAAELRARARDHGVPDLQVVEAPSHLTLGACLNRGAQVAGGDLIAKMDDDNYYGTHYLTDLVQALEAQGAGIAGKWAHYVWLRSTGAVVLRYPDFESAWARRIQGGTMLFTADVLRDLEFADLPRAVDSDILDRAITAGVPIWSADRFNFVSVRGDDRTTHTWTVEDATFFTASGRLAFYGDPRTHVEV
ncbi:hypothetical protein GCM10023349_01630 [Nocardioides conyzicola]|uniref:Glycosyltransferase 2-like domain-containing protein n=1 Tax=Nocardioides conyzicola TaxID=1651781 RepID=A0ABP8WJS5_9ACTN